MEDVGDESDYSSESHGGVESMMNDSGEIQ